MISILDYGSGNIRAFANAYQRLGIPFKIVTRPKELDGASRILLPGVGAFDPTMERLEKSGLREKIETLVNTENVPILGVCVGMQILGRSSEEGTLPGLGWVPGVVMKLDAAKLTTATRLPHLGWNDVKTRGDNRLFHGLEAAARFYFLHSYYFRCDHESEVLATTDYGQRFPSAVKKGNIYGVQFHPEKSHHFGIRLLKNFAEL